MGEFECTICLCGAAHTEKDEVLFGAGPADLTVKCADCGLIRTVFRATNYRDLYTEGDHYHVDLQRAVGHEPYDARFEHDLVIAEKSRIPRLLNQMRSLDVGCANGAFVRAMEQLGIRADGIELNPAMALEAASQLSFGRVFTSWDHLAQQTSDTYDIITYHDVFEHIEDPQRELTNLKIYLAFEGLLVLDVPDAAEVFGKDARAAHHIRPEQHLWYYTEETLTSLLTKHGFAIASVDRPIVGKLVVYARQAFL